MCHALLDTLFLIQNPHSRNLHILRCVHQLCLPTACDTSFLAPAHLPSPSTDSYISHEMKRSQEEQSAAALCTENRYITGILTKVFIFQYSLRSLTVGELIPDDGWWLFTLAKLKFIFRGFISCVHSQFLLDAHSFTLWQWELSVLLLWAPRKSEHIWECGFEVYPLQMAIRTAIKKGNQWLSWCKMTEVL